ncbi:MAG: hypothetical protein ACPGLV_14160, partial [Bacteroidia bacterium]
LKPALFLTFMLAGLTTWAQPPMGERAPRDFDRSEAKALKVGIYTRVLELNTKEAEAFWPVFNEFEEKMQTIKNEEREIRKNVESRFSELKDSEIEKNIDRMMALKTEENELVIAYYEKYKKILPMKKVALIHRAEMTYKRALLNKMREGRSAGNRDDRESNRKR